MFTLLIAIVRKSFKALWLMIQIANKQYPLLAYAMIAFAWAAVAALGYSLFQGVTVLYVERDMLCPEVIECIKDANANAVIGILFALILRQVVVVFFRNDIARG